VVAEAFLYFQLTRNRFIIARKARPGAIVMRGIIGGPSSPDIPRKRLFGILNLRNTGESRNLLHVS